MTADSTASEAPEERKFYEVAIIGAGVTGSAAAYALTFSNIRKVVVVEKYDRPATVNSSPRLNSQTSHEGDTETNYPIAHSLEVRESAGYLRRFISKFNDPTLFQKRLRMVIGVNAKEVLRIRERFCSISKYYPHLSLVDRNGVAKIEPNVSRGRSEKQPFCALVSTEGFIINYQRLAEKLLEEARVNNPQLKCLFNTKVFKVRRIRGGYAIKTSKGVIYAKTIEFASGPWSLYFAHELGYGLDYSILQVAGSFYAADHLLNNKVYRTQVEGRPFAEIHGDPDILDMEETRFGPTTKPIFYMERYHPETLRPYLKMKMVTTLRGFITIARILFKRKLLLYVLKNILFDMPLIGRALFLREAKKIVPNIRYRDLKFKEGAGGVRPQIVNLKTMDIEMGDSNIIGNENGDRLIFNTTPSPGASVCLGNALRDAKKITDFLGSNYQFDKERFIKELGRPSSAA